MAFHSSLRCLTFHLDLFRADWRRREKREEQSHLGWTHRFDGKGRTEGAREHHDRRPDCRYS